MNFVTPALLLLLPAAALASLWRWRRTARRPALAVAELSTIRHAALGQATWRLRLRWIPDALRAVAVALIIVAVARPQQGLAITLLPEDGIDVVVVLDTSSSMENLSGSIITDATMSKLAVARSVVDEFVSGLRGDRVGLVVFQSTALALSPLTLDHDALRRAVEEVRSGLLPDGTAIGLGLAEALNLLRDSPARSRVIVLLTDGQNNKGAISPLEAAQLADVLGVRVYTIGFVSPVSAPTVDEATLRAVAELTGAAYYDAATRQELAAAYAAIGALERSRVGERRFTTFREFAPWLAGAALMVLAAEAVLRATALRRYP